MLRHRKRALPIEFGHALAKQNGLLPVQAYRLTDRNGRTVQSDILEMKMTSYVCFGLDGSADVQNYIARFVVDLIAFLLHRSR